MYTVLNEYIHQTKVHPQHSLGTSKQDCIDSVRLRSFCPISGEQRYEHNQKCTRLDYSNAVIDISQTRLT